MGNTRFARYALAVLGYNIFVILWGAFVRASGSGAGCGRHWPLCNGEIVPRTPAMETIVELGHRVTSGVALLLVVGMLVWAFRAYPRGHRVRTGATLSFVFILVEALVGAGLVLLELVAENASVARAYWMIAHLLNTFVLLAVLTITWWWAAGGRAMRFRGSGAVGVALAAACAGILVVGATGAIAALGDTLFPADTLAQGLRDSFSADSHLLVRLRKLHPMAAVLVGAAVVFAGRFAVSRRPSDVGKKLVVSLFALYGAQLVAGVVNVVLLAPVWLQLLHLLLADLVWITFILLAAETLRADAPTETTAAPGVLAASA